MILLFLSFMKNQKFCKIKYVFRLIFKKKKYNFIFSKNQMLNKYNEFFKHKIMCFIYKNN